MFKKNKIYTFFQSFKNIFLGLFILAMNYLIYYSLSEYFFHFKSFSRSNNPADWGAFGDYIGGVLNPIIAIIGTTLLAIITVQLSKSDSEEKHNYFIMEKKIEAFAQLTSKVNNLQNLKTKVSTLSYITKGTTNNLVEAIDKEKNAGLEMIHALQELCNEILSFELKYEHIFQYNFHCKDYKNMLKNIEDIFSEINYISSTGSKNYDRDKEKKLINSIDIFLVEIKKELVMRSK